MYAIFLVSLITTSAFARDMRVCGILKQNNTGYSVVTKNDNWISIESGSKEASEKLFELTKPLYIPTFGNAPERNAKVCITGEVILNDEDKGTILGVSDPSKIVELK